jgi:hypothetical protein
MRRDLAFGQMSWDMAPFSTMMGRPINSLALKSRWAPSAGSTSPTNLTGENLRGQSTYIHPVSGCEDASIAHFDELGPESHAEGCDDWLPSRFEKSWQMGVVALPDRI